MKRGNKSSLSEKQYRFIEEYLIDLNATQAAIRAGYSATTAYSQGQRLLKHVEVKRTLAAAKKARAERMAISADRVLLELARIAYFDIRKTVSADGAPIPIEKLDPDTAAAIAGIEILEQFEGSGEDRVFVGYLKKYRVFDKNAALTNAMRHLGMLKDSIALTLPPGGTLVKVEFVDAPAKPVASGAQFEEQTDE